MVKKNYNYSRRNNEYTERKKVKLLRKMPGILDLRN